MPKSTDKKRNDFRPSSVKNTMGQGPRPVDRLLTLYFFSILEDLLVNTGQAGGVVVEEVKASLSQDALQLIELLRFSCKIRQNMLGSRKKTRKLKN